MDDMNDTPDGTDEYDTAENFSDESFADHGPDPFDAEHAPAVQLVVQMRIYDVLMAIYTHLDADGARELHELHEKGLILGSLPFIDIPPE